ncbi:response regulator [Oscillatoriales cyanobacterium LEGE 11467]|uniref:histidine kinase n=1 Tax=Zarconia navalis LEGE 11467 TaxID=1828826 RepID=A0A928VVM6_9CYAN|nr:response regulator [Zarconia navalis]MBE9040113.1 response regulator [Zarconia navalis LEGE 11467]
MYKELISEKDNVILVVDDTPTNLEVLSSALTDENYQVAVAIDGESAIEQIKYKPPDLILMDVMMPGIDGFETCTRLKSDRETQDIPIIFMTALSDPIDKVKGLKLGAVDYITKPFQKEEVLARVRVHLQLYNLNRNLEHRVEARTLELSQALHRLQKAQLQLVQSEKMSSLGQMIAGIAHEINNPVNFIHGNLVHAKDYIVNLLEFVDFYKLKNPNPDPKMAQLMEDIDLEFVRDDLPKLVSSMQVGTERIQGIVQSLRNFSRLDESACKPVNIHEGIESTLVILGNRLKGKGDRPKIEVKKEYQNLPLIECYCGQLNQVFMNIISNAIDALEDTFDRHISKTSNCLKFPKLQIRIRTKIIDSNWVSIHITDSGLGIPQELQTRLFDPFFTTKPVGKGTGMGLSISYQIVTEKHGGELKCISKLDRGTEFVIVLPIRSPLPSRG